MSDPFVDYLTIRLRVRVFAELTIAHRKRGRIENSRRTNQIRGFPIEHS